MEALEAYLVSCLPSGAKYGFSAVKPVGQAQEPFDGARARALIETFAEPLCDHVRFCLFRSSTWCARSDRTCSSCMRSPN